VNKTWQLVELYGCWWAYEGELPPPEAFRTHGHAGHILGPFSPLAQWQSNSSHESWLAAQAATSARLHLGADGGKIATKSCAKSSALVECPWLRRSA
jgi:hypothetical protein